MKMMKTILIAMIKFYRRYLSPLKTTKCPYFPTCSEYGLEAVEKYGAVKRRTACRLEDFKVQSFFQRRV